MPADTLLAQANRRAGGPSGVVRTLSTQITADVAEPIKAQVTRGMDQNLL
jgi:hypothetical protein